MPLIQRRGLPDHLLTGAQFLIVHGHELISDSPKSLGCAGGGLNTTLSGCGSLELEACGDNVFLWTPPVDFRAVGLTILHTTGDEVFGDGPLLGGLFREDSRFWRFDRTALSQSKASCLSLFHRCSPISLSNTANLASSSAARAKICSVSRSS